MALYSHDTQGLGHIRRNTLLAAALVQRLDAEVLLVAGTSQARHLPLPPRTRLVTLPGIRKHPDGTYSPRQGTGTLADVSAARARLADAELQAFAPDLLVVDKVARGFDGDLEPALRRLRARTGTQIVLGLRDVLDDAGAASREWDTTATSEAIADYYDQVWVYGDRRVYDPIAEYGLPAVVAAKMRFTGYLGRGREELLGDTAAASTNPATFDVAPTDPSPTDPSPYVLCLVGGGQDGAALADGFANAAFPAGHHGVLITGPFLPKTAATALRDMERRRRDLTVLSFVSHVPRWVREATATVTMGGYNSVCEVLAVRGRALVVPRIAPRREQAVRAERLSRAGLLDVYAPDGDPDPRRISRWLADSVHATPPAATAGLDGLRRVPDLAAALLDRTAHHEQELFHAAV